MKIILLLIAVVAISFIMGNTYHNESNSVSFSITSTSKDSEVTFKFVRMSDTKKLEIQELTTPLVIKLNEIKASGYMIEKISGKGKLKVYDEKDSGGAGNSIVITHINKEVSITVLN